MSKNILYEDDMSKVSIQISEFTNHTQYRGFSKKNGAEIEISVYNNVINLEERISRSFDGANYSFFGENPKYCKLSIDSFYSRSAPKGFIRVMLCYMLRKIISIHKDIQMKEGIFLYACGHIRGTREDDYESLLKYYRKIGFADFAIQKDKSECNVYMTSTIHSIMDWCTQYY